MKGLELYEEILQDMEKTTIDDIRGSITESRGVPEKEIERVYNDFMKVVHRLRKEHDDAII